MLQYEDGRFAEAPDHFTSFADAVPRRRRWPPRRKLRQGFCQVQLKQHDDGHQDAAAARRQGAGAWPTRRCSGSPRPRSARPTRPSPSTYKAAPSTRSSKAAEQGQRARQQPTRRRSRAAARSWPSWPRRSSWPSSTRRRPTPTATILQRQAAARPRGRDDAQPRRRRCTWPATTPSRTRSAPRSSTSYKDSTLLPAVLFRQAENAAFAALAAEKNPNPPDRAKRGRPSTTTRPSSATPTLVEKYPEYAHVNLARHGLGMAHYRKGDLEKAQKALEAIPAADRTGELAVVAVPAGRRLPAAGPGRADDAVAAGKLEEKLQGRRRAAGGVRRRGRRQPAGARRAAQARLLPAAAWRSCWRSRPSRRRCSPRPAPTYERVQQKFAKHDVVPAGDVRAGEGARGSEATSNGAMNELTPFAADPLKKSAVAPMALLHLATLLRGAEQARRRRRDAGRVPQGARGRAERRPGTRRLGGAAAVPPRRRPCARRASSPRRGAVRRGRQEQRRPARGAGTRPCVPASARRRTARRRSPRRSKKLADAEPQAARSAPRRRSSSADGMQDVARRGAVPGRAGAGVEGAQGRRRGAAADAGRRRAPGCCTRRPGAGASLADLESEAARTQAAAGALAEAPRRGGEGDAARPERRRRWPMPEVPLRDVPVQPAETQARKQYQALITAFPDAGHQRRRPLRAGRAARPSATSTTRRSSCCKGR